MSYQSVVYSRSLPDRQVEMKSSFNKELPPFVYWQVFDLRLNDHSRQLEQAHLFIYQLQQDVKALQKLCS